MEAAGKAPFGAFPAASFKQGILTEAVSLHQLADQLRIGHGVFQREVCHQQRLSVKELGVVLRLFRIGGHSGFHSLEGGMLRIQLQNPTRGVGKPGFTRFIYFSISKLMPASGARLTG